MRVILFGQAIKVASEAVAVRAVRRAFGVDGFTRNPVTGNPTGRVSLLDENGKGIMTIDRDGNRFNMDGTER